MHAHSRIDDRNDRSHSHLETWIFSTQWQNEALFATSLVLRPVLAFTTPRRADQAASSRHRRPPSESRRWRTIGKMVADIQAELFAQVCAAPEDDGPRAVLADWWSERGDPRGELAAARAMLRVRPQLEVVASVFDATKHRAWYAELEAAVPGVKLTQQEPGREDWSEHFRTTSLPETIGRT